MVTMVSDDEDTAVDQFAATDEDEDDEDAEVSSTRGRASSYEDAERKFRSTVAKQLAKYRTFLDEKYNARKATLDLKVQNRLDEWAMAHVGTSGVSNPEQVAESLARQVQATEQRLNAFREQLAALAESGVDIAAIQAQLASLTNS